MEAENFMQRARQDMEQLGSTLSEVVGWNSKEDPEGYKAALEEGHIRLENGRINVLK